MFDWWHPKSVGTGAQKEKAGYTAGMKWGEAKAWLKSGGFVVGNLQQT